jgi:DNA-binding transcriptional MocR family regulator
VDAISDLPMHNDIDADYSPQYVKLARIIRSKIESGDFKRGDAIPATGLAREHEVSTRVARAALAMLAANRYVAHADPFKPYHVTWTPHKLTRGHCGAPVLDVAAAPDPVPTPTRPTATSAEGLSGRVVYWSRP